MSIEGDEVCVCGEAAAQSQQEQSPYLLRTIDYGLPRPLSTIAHYTSLHESFLVLGSHTKVHIVDDVDYALRRVCQGHRRSVLSVATSDIGYGGENPVVVSGGRAGEVVLWSPRDDFDGESIEMPVHEIRCMSVYQGSVTWLLLGSRDSQVVLWDLTSDTVVASFQGHRGCVHCVSLQACVEGDSSGSVPADVPADVDNMCIVSGGADRTARLWDWRDPKRRPKKLKHEKPVGTVVIASKGTRPLVATGASNFAITVWDVETGYKLRTFEGHRGPVTDLIFWEHYEVLMISASTDRSIRVVDVLTGECVCVLLGHTDDIRSLVVVNNSREEPVLVSVALDYTMRIWDFARILSTFYRPGSENEGIEVGSRNATPPYTPDVSYSHTSLLPRSKKELHKERHARRRHSLLASPEAFQTPPSQTVDGSAARSLGRPKSIAARRFSLLPTDAAAEDGSSKGAGDKERPRGTLTTSPLSLSRKVQPEPCPEPTKVETPFAQRRDSSSSSSSESDSDTDDVQPQAKLSAAPYSTAPEGEAASTPRSSRKVKTYPPPSPAPQPSPVPKLRSDSSRSIDRDSFKSTINDMLGLASRLPSFTRGNSSVKSASADSADRGDREAPIASAISNIASSISKAFGRFSAAVGVTEPFPEPSSLLASAVIEKFDVAAVAKEIDSELSRSRASVNLRRRLSMKKNPNLQVDSEGLLEHSAAGAEALVTAAKMQEHRLQEQRVKQSLNRAKARSSQALKRRLEEVAALRRGPGGGKAAGDSDQDDDDDDDKDSDSDQDDC